MLLTLLATESGIFGASDDTSSGDVVPPDEFDSRNAAASVALCNTVALRRREVRGWEGEVQASNHR